MVWVDALRTSKVIGLWKWRVKGLGGEVGLTDLRGRVESSGVRTPVTGVVNRFDAEEVEGLGVVHQQTNVDVLRGSVEK